MREMPIILLSIIGLESIALAQQQIIIVDLNIKEWRAYQDGELVKSGPAAGGSKKCRETGKYQCFTPIGEWPILRKEGKVKKSTLYPVECKNKKKCGFPMIYYMQFHRSGAGLHGVKNFVHKNTSHGCVRLLPKDAEWLNKEFVKQGVTRVKVLRY